MAYTVNKYKSLQATFLTIILLLCVLVGSSQSSDKQLPDTRNDTFIPNDSVKQLAIEMDRKYFPVFLSTLQNMRNENFGFLNQYYDSSTLFPSVQGKQEIRIDTLKPVVVYYFEKNANSLNAILLSSDKYKICFPVDWKANPHNDRSWQLWFHSLAWVQNYLASDDQDTILTGLKIIQDIIMNNLVYPSENGEFIFDDMGIGSRLKTFSIALKKYHSLNITDSVFYQQLLSGILATVAFMSSLETYKSWHNHGIFVDQALLFSMSELEGFLARKEVMNLALSRGTEQFRYCFTADGIHKEHTPAYHIWMTRELKEFISLANQNQLSIPENLNGTLIKAQDYFKYLCRPNELIPPIGDCGLDELKSFFNSYSKDSLKSTEPIKIFPYTNWVFFNSSAAGNPINVIIQADFFSKSHYQEDETSFIITVADHELIIDPGLYSYNKTSQFDIYMRQARAHNLLLVDNMDFDFRLYNAGLSGLTRYVVNDTAGNDWKGIIEMTHPHFLREKGVEVHRQFGQINDSCFVIKDITKANKDHLYSQLFHFAPEATIKSIDSNSFIVSWPDHGIKIWLTSNTETYEVIEGAMDPAQGWYFPKQLEAIPQPVLILKKNGRSEEIITFLAVIRGAEMPEMNHLQNIALTMFETLDSIPRKTLERQPYPERWKPIRK